VESFVAVLDKGVPHYIVACSVVEGDDDTYIQYYDDRYVLVEVHAAVHAHYINVAALLEAY
jgi:hypothetical protein